jgi:hypothetical protein
MACNNEYQQVMTHILNKMNIWLYNPKKAYNGLRNDSHCIGEEAKQRRHEHHNNLFQPQWWSHNELKWFNWHPKFFGSCDHRCKVGISDIYEIINIQLRHYKMN